jgi:cation diffusion facilitator CzcD-associated flavoprotein CzcO
LLANLPSELPRRPFIGESRVSLIALEHQLARDLDMLGRPPASWTAPVTGPDGAVMRDVLIVGAGVFGLAAATALIFRGIRNIEVLDRAPEGREGIWTTTARMPHLRSPKRMPGLSMGMATLTFRAWFTATHDEAAWDALYKFPTADWQDYLTWLRRVLALPVRNEVAVHTVLPRDGFLQVETCDGRVFARRVVLATGGRGSVATAVIPKGIAQSLWPDRAAHSSEEIDFVRLAGKRVAVMGGSASAWDNASTALAAGAARVDLFVRRPALRQINPWVPVLQTQGLIEGWPSLPPEERWALSVLLLREKATTAPHESVRRATAYENFAAHLASPILSAEPQGDVVALRIGPAPGRVVTSDFLVLGTGFDMDPGRAPELAAFLPHVTTWADRYTPPPELAWPALGRLAYLGEGFELIERAPGACPAAGRVHLFNFGAFASAGVLGSEIVAATPGAERLATRIAAAFAREDIAHLRGIIDRFDQPELIDTPFYAPGTERF